MSIAAYSNGLPFDSSAAVVMGGNYPQDVVATMLGPCQLDSSLGVCSVAWGAQASPLSVIDGLTFDADGRLVTVAYGSQATPVSYLRGLMIDANGALVTVAVGSAVAPIEFVNGVPVDATGSCVIGT